MKILLGWNCLWQLNGLAEHRLWPNKPSTEEHASRQVCQVYVACESSSGLMKWELTKKNQYTAGIVVECPHMAARESRSCHHSRPRWRTQAIEHSLMQFFSGSNSRSRVISYHRCLSYGKDYKSRLRISPVVCLGIQLKLETVTHSCSSHRN